jgi:hypothetical protein
MSSIRRTKYPRTTRAAIITTPTFAAEVMYAFFCSSS